MDLLSKLSKRNSGTFSARITDTSDGVRVDQFPRDPNCAAVNVGVCFSGGGSRAMIAGMGQLRALKYLQSNGQSLLSQTKALSTVSGGSWVGQTFCYLDRVPDDAFLNTYVADPGRLVPSATVGHSQAEILDHLPEGNLGRCIDTRLFSPVGLLVTAYLLWKFAKVPPRILWQTLVGLHILKPYGLYEPDQHGAPNSLFSFNRDTLAQDVVGPNPALAQQTAHLVANGPERMCRPFPICNMAMFVNTGEPFKFLAAAQSTPFFTGILGVPGGVDANGLSPGGGGVTSFAFNSQPLGPGRRDLWVEQQRQWALADSIGTSSACFAKAIENLLAQFGHDIGDFFQRVETFAEELEQWLRDLIAEVPQVGVSLSRLLDGLRDLNGTSKTERVQQLEGIFERMGMGRKVLQEEFRKLAITGIVPLYDYWPAKEPSPVEPFRATHFADGGNLENTGIGGLLAYGDIDRLIAFVNSSTPLAAADRGALDSAGQEVPNTRVIVDDQIPPLFGYQPYKRGKGYRLYMGDGSPANPQMSYNQVFPSEDFPGLLQVLWTNSGSGSNQQAAVCRQDLDVLRNDWFGILARPSKVGVLWVYNNRVGDWYQQLRPEVQRILGNFHDPDSFNRFPNYPTLDTDLDATQINLLASLSAWVVANEDNAGLFRAMYKDWNPSPSQTSLLMAR